VKDKELSR